MFSTEEGYYPIKSDIWSFGICLYTFVAEKLHFYTDTVTGFEIDVLAKNNAPEIPEFFSESLKKIVGLCLNKDPKNRPSISELKAHAWFSNFHNK